MWTQLVVSLSNWTINSSFFNFSDNKNPDKIQGLFHQLIMLYVFSLSFPSKKSIQIINPNPFQSKIFQFEIFDFLIQTNTKTLWTLCWENNLQNFISIQQISFSPPSLYVCLLENFLYLLLLLLSSMCVCFISIFQSNLFFLLLVEFCVQQINHWIWLVCLFRLINYVPKCWWTRNPKTENRKENVFNQILSFVILIFTLSLVCLLSFILVIVVVCLFRVTVSC